MTNEIMLPKMEIIKKESGWSYERATYDFPFKTKEEYLAWVMQWKLQYKELSFAIKTLKNLRNNGFRNKDCNVYNHQHDIAKFKNDATCFLELRKQGKIVSWANKNATLK